MFLVSALGGTFQVGRPTILPEVFLQFLHLTLTYSSLYVRANLREVISSNKGFDGTGLMGVSMYIEVNRIKLMPRNQKESIESVTFN